VRRRFEFTLLVLSVLCSLTTLASAEILSVEDLKAIQQKMRAADSLQADFKQVRFSSLRKKSTESNGYAVFAKPDKFRWSILKPISEEWLFDGTSLFNVKPDRKVALKYVSANDKAKELRDLVDLILNFDTLLSRYTLRRAELVRDKLLVILTPNSSSEIDEVEMTIFPEKSYVSEIKLSFRNKNSLSYLFAEPSKKPLAPNAFELEKTVKITDTL
jgi:outer membrane lipoprotein-sorting protein